jgi:hypothetical protein
MHNNRHIETVWPVDEEHVPEITRNHKKKD